jgi:probable DNA metabolism protein
MGDLPVAVFDGSFEGFMCAIHAMYHERLDFLDFCEEEHQLSLGAFAWGIGTDLGKAARVIEAIGKKVSTQALSICYNCFLSGDENRLRHLASYIKLGFKLGKDVDLHLQNPEVSEVHRLARRTAGEAHKLTGFCRFSKTSDGVFYCSISPENNVLPILANHFADRLSSQQWVLHDARRKLAAIYDGKEVAFFLAPQKAGHALGKDEEQFRGLWRAFFEAIAVEGRKNPKLQANMLPLRYRGHMTEF